MYFGNAEHVEIECDESGFLLHVDTEDFGRISVRLAGDTAEDLYNAARVEVRPWLLERDAAKVSYVNFRCSPDESAGWAEELRDPKHPRYHSVHVDLWDARADK